MNTLTLDVSKNTLKISAAGSMTSGNEGYLQVSLILDADWAGAAIYPAYVVGGTEYSDYPATAISGTTFIIPTAIGQSDGIIRLGLIGVADSVIMRTNYVFIPLLIGAATGTAVPLPTPAALEALQAAIAAKQDTLTAGTNITITDNVISASGAVNSVNGETGDVVLTASEVGADASGTAASAVAAHNQSETAHSALLASYATQSYVDSAVSAAISDAIGGSY